MKQDLQKIIQAFLLSFFVVYGLQGVGFPKIIVQGYFLLMIAYVFNSRDDVFWLAWFFIIVNAPGRLFGGGYGQPAYSLGAGVSFSFQELFLLMYVFKMLRQRVRYPFIFRREMTLYLAIGLFYFIMSFAFGMSLHHIIQAIRMLWPWLWVFVLAAFIRDQKDLKRFFLLLVPFAVIALAAVVQTYITGSYLGDMLSGGISRRSFDLSEDKFARVYSSAILNVTTFILAVYFLAKKHMSVNPNLLNLVVVVSALNVILSGTRGWILFILIVFAYYFVVYGSGALRQSMRILLVFGLVFLVLVLIFPGIISQIVFSYERFLTLESLAEGDITAGGTLARLDVRSPRVMAVWRESPVIGWGFSRNFHTYMDPHVANQTNLLNLGIFGFILINLIYASLVLKTSRFGLRRDVILSQGKAASVFISAFLGLFVAHSSSGGLWGYYCNTGLFWGIIFAGINVDFNPFLVHQAGSPQTKEHNA